MVELENKTSVGKILKSVLTIWGWRELCDIWKKTSKAVRNIILGQRWRMGQQW